MEHPWDLWVLERDPPWDPRRLEMGCHEAQQGLSCGAGTAFVHQQGMHAVQALG